MDKTALMSVPVTCAINAISYDSERIIYAFYVILLNIKHTLMFSFGLWLGNVENTCFVDDVENMQCYVVLLKELYNVLGRIATDLVTTL